jgi:serine/threonine protein kinase
MIQAGTDLRAQLADAGLRSFKVKEMNAEAERKGPLGKPYVCLYGSPRISGTEEFDELSEMQSDIFGLGLIVYEILTSRTPYYQDLTNRGMSEAEIAVLVHENNWRPELPSYFSDDLKETLSRMWSSNSDDRPDIEEVILGLETAI